VTNRYLLGRFEWLIRLALLALGKTPRPRDLENLPASLLSVGVIQLSVQVYPAPFTSLVKPQPIAFGGVK
jgi:hypothetical protein